MALDLERERGAAITQIRTLDDLLARWGRLEPGRRRATEGAFEVKLGAHWHLVSCKNTLPDLGRGALLAVLHDALAEAGLNWTLASGADGCTATVRLEGGLGERVTHSVTTHSESMALLWAYLELLAPTPGGLSA